MEGARHRGRDHIRPLGPAPILVFAVCAGGIGLYSTMDAFMKGLSLAIGAYAAMVWRCGAALAMSAALFAGTRAPWPSRPVLGLHIGRGLLMTVMALAFFWGLARVPMAQAIALAFVAPLLSLGLAAVVLKERIGMATIAASALAFGGVLLIGREAATAPTPAALAGAAAILFSALCYAVNIILMRRQALVAKPIEIAFFQNLVMTAALLPAAPLFAAALPAAQIPAVLIAAALGLVSSLLLAWAYARAPASYLSMTEYTGFLWAALLGWLVFGERLSPATTAGAMLIVLGCLAATHFRPAPLAAAEGNV